MSHILAALDFSELTCPIIQQAIRFGKASDSPITLIHVAAPNPAFVSSELGSQSLTDARAQLLKSEHAQLQKQAEKIASAGLEADTLLVVGDFVETILTEANRLESDLIILGSHGHGVVYDLLIGSVCEGVVRRASCPVLITPQACAEKQSSNEL